MEYLIASSIVGLGYIYSNNKQHNTFKQSKKSKIPYSEKSNSNNYYTNHTSYNIKDNEQNKANILFNKSKYPEDTNVITPGPPYPIINNKVDYIDKNLPIEFDSNKKYEEILVNDINHYSNETPNNIINNKSVPESGGFQGISLTGNPIEPNNFTHNNQQPFFGSTIKQNLDEFSTRGIMENFTGTNDNYQKKQEQTQFFEQQKNMTNVYGTQNMDGYMLDRYHVSNMRDNESPIEKINVGPGLNQGFTSNPSGGFQQSDTRDYVVPKTTDESRVKTNPKVSYYGRINPGEKISKPGKVGTIYKNKPDTFYVQNADRYLTTTGQVIAPEQRPCIISKYTNRKTTEAKTRKGSAAPTRGTVAQVRSKYKVSHKVSYKYDDPVNKSSNDQWSILNLFSSTAPNDYGKKTIKLKNTKKTAIENKNIAMNYKSENGLAPSRPNQKIKKPKKYNTIHNNRHGNLKGESSNIVYDPNDVARTTIKEQNIDNNFRSNASVSTRGNTVYDPNSIARTTIKEQNIDNNFRSNASVSTRGNTVYDPNNVTRTTIKEQNIDNNFRSNASVSTRGNTVYDPNNVTRTTIKEQNIDNNFRSNASVSTRGNTVYDPNNVTRTTIKEQNIDNNFRSNASVSTRGNTVYDPESKARTTIKEQNIDNNRDGNVGDGKKGAYSRNEENAKKTIKQSTLIENSLGIATEPRNDAYLSTDVQAVGTQRATTSIEYFGDADGPDVGGYDVTEVDAKKTKKEDTSNIEYTGNGGNDAAPMSYEDIYNSTIKSIRGDIDDGYTPGASAPNNIVGGNNIHATTNKLNEVQNQYLNERGTQATKVYNSIPQIELTNITQNKPTVPNEPLADRMNPEMIKAFQENPYTQSLKSWA